MKSRKALALCSAAMGLVSAFPALAQTADGGVDIIVTAQRREENVQKVGAAITALTSERLEQFRVKQAVDLAPLTSGLSTFNFGGDSVPAFSIRGIGLDDFNPNNSSGTAVYIDGVYQTGPVFLAGQMYDIGRVEVLKGPQGTLYGKNATGGAISIISKGPTDQLDGHVTAGYGRWDTFDLNGAIGGPLGGGFSARVAGTMTYQGHGWQKDIDTGKRYGKTERYAGRAMLKYESGNFNTVLNAHISQDSSTPSSYQEDNISIPGLEDAFGTGTTDPTKVRVGGLDLIRDESSYGFSLTTNIDLGAVSLFNVIGYDYIDRVNVDNNDGVPQPIVDYFQDEHVKQFYTETRLSSNEPLFGRINWILGTSYSMQHFRANDSIDFSGFFVGLFEDGDIFTPGRYVSNGRYLQKPTSLGFFLHTSTNLTDSLRLVLGARYSSEKIRVDGVATQIGVGGIASPFGTILASLDESHTKKSLDYKAGLEYDFTDRIMGYATTSTATKSGLYHLGPPTSPEMWRYTRPEDITAYEVGLKTSFFDRKLIFNTAAFYYDYKDRQSSVAFFTATQGFAVGLINIPKSRIKGFEMDVTARPVKQLTFSGTLAHLDAKVRKGITNVDGFDLLGGPVFPGNPLAQAPRWSYSLQGTFAESLSDNVNASLQLTFYRTSVQFSAAADPLGEYGPNSALDGRFTLASKSGWEASLWGKNLTNNRDRTATNAGLVGRTVFRRKPTSYGIEVTRRF